MGKRREIDQKLLDSLLEIAKIIIEDRPENDNFKQNPDDPGEHDLSWHQFGIITHTRKFCEFHQTKSQEYFRQWGIDKEVNRNLTKQIAKKVKAELLEISIPLHDLGKFARGFKEKSGKLVPDYNRHWEKSEKLIMENEQIRNLLQETCGLTSSQVIFIARCAGLHYELGKVRDQAETSDSRYTIAFAESRECRQACDEIAHKFPEFKEEIGIMFLGDSLAKTDIAIDAKTDQDIENQTEQIKQIIQQQGLNDKLVAAVKERPVSIAVAKTYLKLINEK